METSPFFLYIEGPRDRELLRAWARRISRKLERELGKCCVILGGRRPARARAHLSKAQGDDPEASGLCLLDSDEPRMKSPPPTKGLQYFTWGRRHIESYLLVRRPLLASIGPQENSDRIDRVLREYLPASDDELVFRRFDAKHLLGPKGPVALILGRTLNFGQIARGMRSDEVHDDVHAFLKLAREGLGLREPTVTRRERAMG